MSVTSFDEHGNLNASADGVKDGLRTASRGMMLLIGLTLTTAAVMIPVLGG